jgi:hypothetical protein
MATPGPTPDLAALAQQYLAIANRANTATGAVVMPSAPTLAQVKAAYTKLAAAQDDYSRSVLALPWPAPLEQDAKDLVRASDELQSVEANIAAATSIAEVNGHISDLTKAQGDVKAAVAFVRHDLGLPAQ